MFAWLSIGRPLAKKKRASPIVQKKTYLKTFNGALPPKRPVLLYINTTWCGPCKLARPIMEEVARKSKIAVYSVDRDIHKEVENWASYVPTLFFYRNGFKVKYPTLSLSKANPADILAWSNMMSSKK
jgi:thioredoxin 1